MDIRTLMKVRLNFYSIWYIYVGGSCKHKLGFTYHINESKLSYCTSNLKKSTSAPPLTKTNARALVFKLTENERNLLLSSLKEFEAERLKEDYRDQLAAFRWRSKFGRPSKVPNLGNVDPTGSYCPVPEDWLYRKYAETAAKPTTGQLFGVAVHNAVPFVGFGFLDNFVMIVCGDYIEIKLGSLMVLSTMAAAALGNTLSDILGIGSAYYVERAAAKIGVKPPPLSPVQLAMSSSRIASNLLKKLNHQPTFREPMVALNTNTDSVTTHRRIFFGGEKNLTHGFLREGSTGSCSRCDYRVYFRNGTIIVH